MRFKFRFVILLLIFSLLLTLVNITPVKAAQEAGPSIIKPGAKKAIMVGKAAYIDYDTAKKYSENSSEPISVLVNVGADKVDPDNLQYIKDNIYDLIILGGHMIFQDTFGQGQIPISVVRVGGWKASDTARMLNNLHSSIINAHAIKHESGKNYAVQVGDTTAFNSTKQTQIRNKLASGDYQGAVDIIINTIPHGSESRSQTGSAAIKIVLDDAYFYSYDNRRVLTSEGYGVVHTYIYPGRLKTQLTVQPPTLSLDESWTNTNRSFTVSKNSSCKATSYVEYKIGSNGSWTKGTSGTVTAQGQTTVYARAVNDSREGKTYSTEVSKVAKIDKTLPTVTASPSSRDWGNTDVTVTLSYSDSGGSGLSTRQYVWSTSTTAPSSGWQNYSSASGTLIQSSQGSWYLYLRAYDTAGNTVTQRFGPYQIDKTSPTISANPSSRGWGNTNVDVVLTYEDSGGSGLSQRQYAWSQSTSTPSSWTNYSSAVSQSGEGVWYLHARAVDVAGNVTIRRFGPYEIDKTSPSHVSHSITEYRYKKGNDYWIRANDTVKYRMRGKDALSGIRYSYARLVGLGGVDVRSQHDWSGAVDHNNQFQTSEQIAIVKAERIYDGEGQREIEWTINSKEYENDFDVQYYYTDNAGNSIGYISTGIKLRVDATKPDVVISRVNGDVLFSESLIITVTDSRSGLKTVKYSWSFSTSTPSSWTDVSDRIVNNTAVVEINPTIPGPMYLHYYVEDNVGNVASGYAGQYNVIDDSISLDGLALVRVVNPPHGTRVPVVYPVDVPPAVNAGYKLDFAMAVTGADEADIRLYDQDGNRVTMYTTAGAVQTLTILIPSTDSNVVRFTFWLDKEMEEGTILDMEIILRRTLPGGRTTMIGSDSLGKNALQIVGSSKKDWRINLTK